MSAQEKITLSSHAAELNSFSQLEQKTRKKQQKELAHLGMLTRMLEEELAQAQSKSEPSEAAPSEEKGNPMAQLAYDLEMLANTFQKYEALQLEDDAAVAGKVVSADKKKHKNEVENEIKNEIKKIWKKTMHFLFNINYHHQHGTQLASMAIYFKQLQQQQKQGQEKMLNTLITALESLQAAKDAPTSNEGSEPLAKAMAELASVLQMLQVTISKYGNIQANNNYIISEKEVAMSQQNLKELEKKLRKLAKKQKEEKAFKICMKVAEYTAAAISAVVAIVTVQPELLVVTAVSLAAATGATDEVTKGVAQGIELIPGCSKNTAEIVAAVTVTVLIMVLSLMATPAAAAEGAADATEESTGTMAQLSKYAKPASFGLFATTNAVTSTGLVNKSIQASKMSEKKKEEAELIATIVMTAVSLIVSFGAGAAMMEGAGSKAMEADAMLRKLVMYSPHILTLTYLIQGGAGVAEGVYMITQAILQGDLAKINANFKLINTMMQMNSNQTANDQKHEMSQLGIHTGNRSISKLAAGEAAIADVLDSRV